MAYLPGFHPALSRVAATRDHRMQENMEPLDPEAKQALLRQFHPDHRADASRPIPFGPNAGEPCARELVDLLAASSRVDPARVRLDPPDDDVDVLVIGGGGAGAAAALVAAAQGARVLPATKLRLGDSNTIMATGMAAATGPDDSPAAHFLDTIGGGHFSNVPELVEAMVLDGPSIIAWFEDLGVMFDRSADGNFVLGTAGGYSRRRTHSCRDNTGLEMMRVLRDELLTRHIPVLEFHPAVELLLDETGRCAGALLQHLDTGHLRVVRARATVLAAGGMGRLHCHGFPTSNHYGATGDGVVIGYRAGALLLFMDSVQYHPTGVVWPEQMFGWLVTERCRALGAHLVNVEGRRFIYERQTRDAVAAAIIGECERGLGVTTPSGAGGVWLDTPVIDRLSGGRDRPRLAAMSARFRRFGIDIWQEPILVYPTQHYQNGGLRIDVHGRTSVPGLYAAGEVAGGVHGRNRLGGNALLDVFVFGRRAGADAARCARDVAPGRLGLQHVIDHNRRADPDAVVRSPLVLPRYAAPDPRLSETFHA
ncbi:MAG: FAD-binding protein [Armatimonadetes bacterium]|nr:FAD-binding protein [Armatimonadota bacterium]